MIIFQEPVKAGPEHASVACLVEDDNPRLKDYHADIYRQYDFDRLTINTIYD